MYCLNSFSQMSYPGWTGGQMDRHFSKESALSLLLLQCSSVVDLPGVLDRAVFSEEENASTVFAHHDLCCLLVLDTQV